MREAGVRTLVFSSTAADLRRARAELPITGDRRRPGPPTPTAPPSSPSTTMITGEAAAHGLGAVSPALLQRGRARTATQRRAARPGDPPHPDRPPGRRRAAARRSPSSATTTRPRTAPASATTSTSPTWPRPTCSRSTPPTPGEHLICNLGNGNGFSVREVIEAVREVTGHPIPARSGPRRAGDPAVLVASAAPARRASWAGARAAPTCGHGRRRLGVRRSTSQHDEGAAACERRRVTRRFDELYGAAPEGVWAAPGRVNLIGEHTDYNDGFVLPFALPHTAVAAVPAGTDGVLRLHSGGHRRPVVELRRRRPGARGRITGWAAYPAGVVWALREAGPRRRRRATASSTPTCPTGAGLSSSAALEFVGRRSRSTTCTASACPARAGPARPARGERLRRRARAASWTRRPRRCCTEGHALYLDCRDLSSARSRSTWPPQGLRLLVVDTRVKHALGDGAYADRRAGCEEGAPRCSGVPRAARRRRTTDLRRGAGRGWPTSACAAGPARGHRRPPGGPGRSRCWTRATVRAIGPVLTDGHASLRDDLRVSCPELDLAVAAAIAGGALGARMTGGGFGGSAIVLVESTDADSGHQGGPGGLRRGGLRRAPGSRRSLPAARFRPAGAPGRLRVASRFVRVYSVTPGG